MAQFDQAKNEDINTTRSLRPCPDSDGLGWLVNENSRVGYVSEVNGPDSAEVLNFVPTRYELIQLVKHWATISIDYQFDLFLYHQPGSVGRQREAFAGRRIDRIATVLGEEVVEKAINKVEEEFSKTVSPRAWWIFKNGTKEEQFLFQEEFLTFLYSPCGETSDMDSEGEEQEDVDGQ
jgi:hypothetical protein